MKALFEAKEQMERENLTAAQAIEKVTQHEIRYERKPGFDLLEPLKDEAATTQLGMELYFAVAMLGWPKVDPQGLLFSWLSTATMVAVERNAELDIVGICLFQVGVRWLFSDNDCRVLAVAGRRKEMLDFVKIVARSNKCQSLFHEEEEPLEETDAFKRYVIRRDYLAR